jgi:hypothetical protein
LDEGDRIGITVTGITVKLREITVTGYELQNLYVPPDPPRRRPHGSITFRGFDPVNGLRPPEAAREKRAIDRVKTSEKRGFHEDDGALRQALLAVAGMRILPA